MCYTSDTLYSYSIQVARSFLLNNHHFFSTGYLSSCVARRHHRGYAVRVLSFQAVGDGQQDTLDLAISMHEHYRAPVIPLSTNKFLPYVRETKLTLPRVTLA